MNTLIASLAAQSDGLTLRDYLTDIPHDPAAILLYALLLAAIVFIVAGSRSRSRSDRENPR